MRHKSGTRGSGSEQMIRTIKRKTRRQHSAEEKIRILLDGLATVFIGMTMFRPGTATILGTFFGALFIGGRH